jgi:kinesin family member 2/24
MQLRA